MTKEKVTGGGGATLFHRKYAYDTLLRRSKVEDPVSGWQSLFYYDAGGRLLRVIAAAGGGANPFPWPSGLTTVQTDKNGNILRMQGTDWWMAQEFDYEQRMTRVRASNGDIIVNEYDAMGARLKELKTSAGSTTQKRLVCVTAISIQDCGDYKLRNCPPEEGLLGVPVAFGKCCRGGPVPPRRRCRCDPNWESLCKSPANCAGIGDNACNQQACNECAFQKGLSCVKWCYAGYAATEAACLVFCHAACAVLVETIILWLACIAACESLCGKMAHGMLEDCLKACELMQEVEYDLCDTCARFCSVS